MKARVCFCPESIAWIRRHLMKSARAKFKTMIVAAGISKSDRRKIRKRFAKGRRKRHFSQKQLAAQRLFARRAKAGTLRRRR